MILVLGLLAGACAPAAPAYRPASAPAAVTPASTPAQPPGASTPAAAQTQPQPLPPGVTRRITATEGAYFVSPDAFEVTGGETVLLEITSKDYQHTFTVSEIGLSVTVPAGGTARQTFTVPNRPGTYKVFCAVVGHRAQGMERTFVVAPGTGPVDQTAPTPPAQPTPLSSDYGY